MTEGHGCFISIISSPIAKGEIAGETDGKTTEESPENRLLQLKEKLKNVANQEKLDVDELKKLQQESETIQQEILDKKANDAVKAAQGQDDSKNKWYKINAEFGFFKPDLRCCHEISITTFIVFY